MAEGCGTHLQPELALWRLRVGCPRLAWTTKQDPVLQNFRCNNAGSWTTANITYSREDLGRERDPAQFCFKPCIWAEIPLHKVAKTPWRRGYSEYPTVGAEGTKQMVAASMHLRNIPECACCLGNVVKHWEVNQTQFWWVAVIVYFLQATHTQ